MSSRSSIFVERDVILYVRPGRDQHICDCPVSYRGRGMNYSEAWSQGLRIIAECYEQNASFDYLKYTMVSCFGFSGKRFIKDLRLAVDHSSYDNRSRRRRSNIT